MGADRSQRYPAGAASARISSFSCAEYLRSLDTEMKEVNT